MVDLWYPKAERKPVGNTGAMNGGPARAVWHITANSTDHKYENERDYFANGGAGEAPHLIWDPFTGQVAQYFPADSRSLSLKNDGSIQTNRVGKYCIQIECVFTQGETVDGKKYNSLKETPLKGLADIVAWLRSLGIVDAWPGGIPTAFARDTVSESTYQNQGGHYGHNQIPGNDHVDPGPMPDLFHLAGSGSGVPKPTPVYAPFPGASFFKLGRNSKLITNMGKALVKAGYKGYKVGPGPVFTQADKRAVQWFQKKQGWSGADADGIPGPETWKRLKVAKP